jgi:hypothetical protein
MKLFARVDVLDAIIRQVEQDDGHGWRQALSETVFVCTQHLLETTGSLVESLLEMGARGDRIFVQGKCYSTCPGVLDRLGRIVAYAHGGTIPEAPGDYRRASLADVDRLCRVASAGPIRKARRVVILDDGGQSIDRIKRLLDADVSPAQVVGIEQTTFGVGRLGSLPPTVILAARSAVKVLLEPPMIVDAILARVPVLLGNERLRCGVIGLGNIGSPLAGRLTPRHDVAVHDVRPRHELPEDGIHWWNRVHWSESMADLVNRSDFILGCTGNDIFKNKIYQLNCIYGIKVFASCSSGDQEFHTLIRYIAGASKAKFEPLGAIDHAFPNGYPPTDQNPFPPHRSLEIVVARGGFPVNFDGSPESVPNRDIQLTRGLLLGSIIQAIHCYPSREHTGAVTRMLDPDIQRFVVDSWRESRPLLPEESDRFPDLDRFDDDRWIRRRSGGHYVPSRDIRRLFRYRDSQRVRS